MSDASRHDELRLVDSGPAPAELFRAVFEQSAIGVAIVELNGRPVLANAALERFLGFTAAELRERTYHAITHPDDLALDATLAEQLVSGEVGSYVIEKRYCRKDATVVWGKLTVSLLRTPAGNPQFVLAMVEDISAQKGADKALRESERRYRRVLDTAYEGVWTIDRAAMTDYVNSRMAEMLGYRVDEMLGRSMFDFMDEAARLEAAENFSRRQQGVMEQHEFRLQRRDGTELWTLMATSAMLDDDGRFVGALAMVTDITERKRSELALRESEARYRGLVELAPDGILVHCDGQIAFANAAAARLLGSATPEALIGRSVLDFLDPRYGETIRHRMSRRDRPGTVFPRLEERIVRLDGSAIDAELAGIATTYQGRPARQIVIRDLTERRRAEASVRELEEQFRHAQKMEAVGQLAGGIAHDFNNLLTIINTCSELLLNEIEATNDLREDVLAIQRAGARATSLTGQLLAFSRKQVLQPKVLDLNAVVEELEPMLRRLIGEDIRVVTRLEPSLVRVKADPGQLEQVLVNLAVNARDAMPDGGTLRIETATVQLQETRTDGDLALVPGAYAMLSVTDTGTGMDETTRSRIFEPFFTTKAVGKGTGLGLSTVYGIIAQSSGYIWCSSEPGRGTTFEVHLPLIGDAEAPATEPERRTTEPRGAEVLLLVEDEQQVRAVARRILEQQGYTILEARDGHDALRIAERYEGRIDALLTDVVMPELAGPQVFQALREARPELRVLYMSGFTDHDSLRRALVRGETAFLRKPFTALGLARAIRAVLDEQLAGSAPQGVGGE